MSAKTSDLSGQASVPAYDSIERPMSSCRTVEPEQLLIRRMAPSARKAFSLLLRAHDYAQDILASEWEFAVEIRLLRDLGVADNDLRWMTGRGWLKHMDETTTAGSETREFTSGGILNFTPRTCFLLTKSGVSIAREFPQRHHMQQPLSLLPESEIVAVARHKFPKKGTLRPKWDGSRQRLYVGSVLVKEFKLRSPNQTTVLSTFEEEHWPSRIDDPLSPSLGVDAKERLRSTIKSMNRHQKHPLIRFSGDGSGQGILWEIKGLPVDK